MPRTGSFKATPLKLHKSDVGLYLGLTAALAIIFAIASMALNTHCNGTLDGKTTYSCETKLPISWVIVGSVVLEGAGIAAVGIKNRKGAAWFGFVKAPVKQSAKLIGLGVVIIAGTELLTALLAKFIPFFGKAEYGLIPTKATLSDIPAVLGLLVFGALIAPVLEEFLFRGVLFRAIWPKTGVILASIISSLMFALAHGISGAALAIFVFGLYLCYMYKRTGSILPGMVLHGLNNFFAILLLALGLGT